MNIDEVSADSIISTSAEPTKKISELARIEVRKPRAWDWSRGQFHAADLALAPNVGLLGQGCNSANSKKDERFGALWRLKSTSEHCLYWEY